MVRNVGGLREVGSEARAVRPLIDKIVRDVTRPGRMVMQAIACDAGQEEYRPASARPQLKLCCRRVRVQDSSCHHEAGSLSDVTAHPGAIGRHGPAPLPTPAPTESPATAAAFHPTALETTDA